MRNTIAPTTRLLIAAALVLVLALAGIFHSVSAASASLAQSAVTLDTVHIDIWPEYDRPSVLVMYNIALSSQVKLPASLSIRIPSGAGDPSAVATRDVNGLYNLQYQTTTEGDWTRISFTTSMPEVRIEYYDPALGRKANQRNYSFVWAGDYQVENLTVQVQQPIQATNLTSTPDLGSGRIAEDGLTYFTLLAGKYDAGSQFKLDFSYQKPDDTLSYPDSGQTVQPVQAVDETTQGRVTLNDILPWILGGLGILLISVGIWWYWLTGRQAEPSVHHSHKPSRRSTNGTSLTDPQAKQNGKQDGAYCHQCGKRAAAGDVFCRACGTRLK